MDKVQKPSNSVYIYLGSSWSECKMQRFVGKTNEVSTSQGNQLLILCGSKSFIILPPKCLLVQNVML
jgi:hypothetical protein